MSAIELVETSSTVLDIHADLSVTPRKREPGPPKRMEGMTVGFVAMQAGDPSPHNGEMHPDGDEILFVSAGKIRIQYDSGMAPIDLCKGQACIVRKGEWHNIECLEDAQLVHITPGPNGEARSTQG